jgi:hypothetical protein
MKQQKESDKYGNNKNEQSYSLIDSVLDSGSE